VIRLKTPPASSSAGGAAIADNLRRFINGEPVANLVDLEQDY
jgi:hypothetical protein